MRGTRFSDRSPLVSGESSQLYSKYPHHERNCPRRRQRHAPLPHHQRREQATAPHFRQADGLLSHFGTDARRHTRHSHHLHAPRFARFPPSVGRRFRFRGAIHLRRATLARRFGASLPHRPRIHRRRQRVSRARRQHFPRRRLQRDAPIGRRHGRARQQSHRFRLPRQRPRTLRCGRLRR